jgi:serine/threonine protein kinase
MWSVWTGLNSANPDAISNECRLLQQLARHPHTNLVQVLGICTDAPDRNVRIVMEYCVPGSLERYLTDMKFVRPLAWSCFWPLL